MTAPVQPAQDRELIEALQAEMREQEIPFVCADMHWKFMNLLKRCLDAILAHEQDDERRRVASDQRAETAFYEGKRLGAESAREQQRSQAAARLPRSSTVTDVSSGGPAADPPRDQPAASTVDDLVERLRTVATSSFPGYGDTIREAADRIERDAQDAERWRYWKSVVNPFLFVRYMNYHPDDVKLYEADKMDAAIDAARGKGK